MPHHSVSKELLRIEIANLELYGFGVKSFMLSMVQAALEIMHLNPVNGFIEKVLSLGKEMLNKPKKHYLKYLDQIENVQKSKGKAPEQLPDKMLFTIAACHGLSSMQFLTHEHSHSRIVVQK
jgi:hypothetical protein